MKIHKHISALIYIVLILACMGVVFLVGRLAEPGPPEESETETSALVEESVATPSEATPSEAEPESRPQESEWPVESTDASGRGAWWWDSYPYQTTEESIPEETEAPYVPPDLMIATDLHYFSSALTDGGAAFEKMIADDDGKTVWYSDEMVDALLEDAVRKQPSALVLTGDITSYGEKENHLRLAEKLSKAQEQGVPILVIPGNHDINSHHATVYYGDEAIPVESVTAEEFADIYGAFGYEAALSRDEDSLSYIYALDESHRMMMLDTCQYNPVNHVNGKLSAGTLAWIREQLEEAAELGIEILPVGHHNLLKESRLYTFDCTMENHMELVELLQEYQIPVYISGHLHAQRVKHYQKEPGAADASQGIAEIVLTPFAIPEGRYGYMKWDEENRLTFRTKTVSVSAWARRNGIEDENLLNFDVLAPGWTKEIIGNQVKKTLFSLPDEQIQMMADVYAEVYYCYTKGTAIDRRSVEASEGWQLWERMAPENKYRREILRMADDCRENHLEWRGEKPQQDGMDW